MNGVVQAATIFFPKLLEKDWIRFTETYRKPFHEPSYQELEKKYQEIEDDFGIPASFSHRCDTDPDPRFEMLRQVHRGVDRCLEESILSPLAAVRPKEKKPSRFLCNEDSFVELVIQGRRGRYCIPLHITGFYSSLVKSQDPISPGSGFATAQGANVIKHFKKDEVVMKIGTYLSWLDDLATTWLQSPIFRACTTHGDAFRGRVIQLMNEKKKTLECTSLSLGPGVDVETATFEFGLENVSADRLHEYPTPYYDPESDLYAPCFFSLSEEYRKPEYKGKGYERPYFPPFFITVKWKEQRATP